MRQARGSSISEMDEEAERNLMVVAAMSEICHSSTLNLMKLGANIFQCMLQQGPPGCIARLNTQAHTHSHTDTPMQQFWSHTNWAKTLPLNINKTPHQQKIRPADCCRETASQLYMACSSLFTWNFLPFLQHNPKLLCYFLQCFTWNKPLLVYNYVGSNNRLGYCLEWDKEWTRKMLANYYLCFCKCMRHNLQCCYLKSLIHLVLIKCNEYPTPNHIRETRSEWKGKKLYLDMWLTAVSWSV